MEFINNIFQYFGKLFEWWVIIMPFEQGIRIRFGKHVKKLTAGTYLKIPFFDTVYVQVNSLRVTVLPVQTVTTKDNVTLSITASGEYSIQDIEKLYHQLYNPEMSVANIILGEIANYVRTHDVIECAPEKIEKAVLGNIKSQDYGLGEIRVIIIGFAIVKTYRLIQDSHWMPDSLNVEKKRGN